MARRRVVLLSPGDSPTPTAPPPDDSLEFVAVSSGYEAAAELLASQAAALVVDLSMLTGPHLKLLEIARARNVDLYGLGSFPPGLSAEDLRGMRMVARSELSAAVEDNPARKDSVRLSPAKPNTGFAGRDGATQNQESASSSERSSS